MYFSFKSLTTYRTVTSCRIPYNPVRVSTQFRSQNLDLDPPPSASISVSSSLKQTSGLVAVLPGEPPFRQTSLDSCKF
jgi:hypothetical protein